MLGDLITVWAEVTLGKSKSNASGKDLVNNWHVIFAEFALVIIFIHQKV